MVEVLVLILPHQLMINDKEDFLTSLSLSLSLSQFFLNQVDSMTFMG